MARDVLWLRFLLAMAQTVIACYALYRGVFDIAAWNTVLVIVNGYWVIKIMRERQAVAIPKDLQETYRQHFAALNPAEFLRFWSLSKALELSAAKLTQQGVVPHSLYWLRAGEVALRHDEQLTHGVDAPCFIGEMSLLTGQPATATVVAQGPVSVRAWPRARLQKIAQSNPVLWAKIQSVLGLDLVLKIQQEQARAQGLPVA